MDHLTQPTQLRNVSKQTKRAVSHHWNGYQDSVSTQSMLHNHANFKSSSTPEKMMTWRDEAWVPLHDDVALTQAVTAFNERRPMVEVQIDGHDCILDFYRMLLVDVETGLQRSVAWIDVNGSCFFPKFFVDETLIPDRDDEVETANPRVEIDVKVDANCEDLSVCGVRKGCDEEIEIEIKIDANESPNLDQNGVNLSFSRKRKVNDDNDDDDDESSCNNGGNGSKRRRLVGRMTWQWPNARLVAEGERSYAFLRDLFVDGMRKVDPGVCVTAIRQCRRIRSKACSDAFSLRARMSESGCGESSAVLAWHGASRECVYDILSRGLGWCDKGRGSGVYLCNARLSHLSDVLSEVDDNGEKHMLLCRVILDNVERVEAGSRLHHPSRDEFDPGVDDLVNRRWYVVRSSNVDTHVLPEWVVSYRRSDSPQGPRKEAGSMNWYPNGSSSVVAQLFSKLRSLLPAVKIEELKALCMTYKAGKMAKDLFINQMKSIAGSEVLRSAISEIKGLS